MSVALPLRMPMFAQLKAQLPRVAAAVVGLLIGAQVLALWREWPAAHLGASAVAQPPSALPARIVDVAAITRAALFGRLPPAPGSLDAANARNGHEGYALKGILALEGEGDGFAIIAGPDGKSRMVRRGESLATNLTVQGVWVDYVLLMDGDSAERLTLPHGPLLATGDRRPRRLMAARMTEPPAPEKTISADTQSTLNLYGLTAIGDPRGQITGLSGRGSPGWAHSGLLPTDVIIAINGKPVDEVLKTPHGIDDASIAAVTVLTVERDGVPVEIDASPYDGPPPLSPAQLRLRRRNGG